MVRTIRLGIMVTGAVLAASGTMAAAPAPAPVRSVDIYVTPYYQAAASARDRRVETDRRFDAALRGDDPAAIRAVHTAVLADGRDVSPITLMILAARLYDIGDRDDGLFWFYAATDRFTQMRAVLTGYGRPGMGGAGAEYTAAMIAFRQLAGPIHNGYAFCDIANQQAQRARAFEWVAASPYALLLDPQAPAKTSDRAGLIAAAVEANRILMKMERDQLADPAYAAQLMAARAENQQAVRYCW